MEGNIRSDGQLLTAYVQGRDGSAFAELNNRYAGFVYSVCLRYLHVPQDAEDAAAACFVVLHQKAGSVKDGKLMPWLHSCAARTALCMAKLRKRRVQREHEAYEMRTLETEDQRGQFEDVLPQLESAVAALPIDQHEVVLMHFYQGLSITEIATKTGIAEGTVASRAGRAIKKLRAKLAQYGKDLSEETVAAGMTNAALMLPVPASLTIKLAAIANGSGTVGDAAMAVAQATMRGMMWARVKIAAGMAAMVVGGVAVPALTANLIFSWPMHPHAGVVNRVVEADSASQVAVVYEDDFNGSGLAPFWEKVQGASQVAVNPPDHASKLVLTVAGAEFNRRTGSAYTSAVQVISQPIANRAGEVLEISLDFESAKTDTACVQFLSESKPAGRSQVDLLDETKEIIAAKLVAQDGSVEQYPGRDTMLGTAKRTQVVFYLLRANRILMDRNGRLALFESAQDIHAVRLRLGLESTHPFGKVCFPVESVSVRRLAALPKAVEGRLHALMTAAKKGM